MANSNHWIQKAADQVQQYAARRKGPEAEIVCASGISPSGTIHLGNLREIMTAHLVTEELLKRGRKAVHLHFWDDYDRFRKVPSNIPAEYSKYIGMPLSEIPDPSGKFASYGEFFMHEFEEQLQKIGVAPTYMRQSELYKKGEYTENILEAMDKRLQAFDTLSQYQSEEQQKGADAIRDSYYPFKVYCESCGKDDTTVESYEAASATVHYNCAHGHKGAYSLREKISGKLVWKIDWPMRWKHYRVDFEPGGVDHSTPGSSYTVGKEVVKTVFNEVHPFYIGYAFVGITGGAAKISSSAGTAASPANALTILEPAMLRWLYTRVDARNSFNINFDDQVFRIYDEWDRLNVNVKSGKASEQEQYVFNTCIKTAAGDVAHSEMLVPFRLLASTYHITQGKKEEIKRIILQHLEPSALQGDFDSGTAMRLNCAANWVDKFMPEEERLVIKDSFDANTFSTFDAQTQEAIGIFVAEFEQHWSLAALNTFIYAIPKRQLGLPLDTKPDEKLKQAQHSFFAALYQMIVSKDTGPRLPTLFLSLGQEKIIRLLKSETVQNA